MMNPVQFGRVTFLTSEKYQELQKLETVVNELGVQNDARAMVAGIRTGMTGDEALLGENEGETPSYYGIRYTHSASGEYKNGYCFLSNTDTNDLERFVETRAASTWYNLFEEAKNQNRLVVIA